jgi:hypothetical protein
MAMAQAQAAHQRDIVAIEQNLVELGDALAFWRDLAAAGGEPRVSAAAGLRDAPKLKGVARNTRCHQLSAPHSRQIAFIPKRASRGRSLFSDVLENHVDVIVESPQGAHELLVPAHDNPYPRPDALVDELCETCGGCGEQ